MYGGIYNRHAPSNSAMRPFPLILRRKAGILIQAALLFLAALTIFAGFRRYTGDPSVAISNKFSDKQSMPPNGPTKTLLLTSSRLLESTTIKAEPLSETTSQKSSLVHETAPSKSSLVPITVSQNSSIFYDTASSKSSQASETVSSNSRPIPETVPAQSILLFKDVNTTLLERASVYVKAIMTPEDDHFPRLACPAPNATRYEYLRRTNSNRDLKYFFALDLHRRAKILLQLIGSIVETIRFLGPEKCALSIVKASWDDGTSIILKLLREDLERIGVMYFVNSSDKFKG